MQQTLTSKYTNGETVTITDKSPNGLIGSKNPPVNGVIIATKFYHNRTLPAYSILINGTESIKEFFEDCIVEYTAQ